MAQLSSILTPFYFLKAGSLVEAHAVSHGKQAHKFLGGPLEFDEAKRQAETWLAQRARHVLLSAEGIEFFREQSKDKLPGARLFTEDGETPWRRYVWAKEVRAAVANHNRDASAKRRISPDASAYSFRHARISELLQIYGVDPITVGAQTGTSVAMIEKVYLRFIPSAMQEKLAALKG